MDYALIVSYVGTGFAGWQRQANAMAVQQVLEEALADLLGDEVRLIGASRTDAGVHARAQVASLALEREVKTRVLVGGVNIRLPAEVQVLEARPMPQGFHALQCARAKRYTYRLVRARVLSPLDRQQRALLEVPVELARLQEAAALLQGRHDFSAFALAGGGHRQPLRRIIAAEWRQEGDRFDFTIEGEGFLRGMVRSLVGTMIEVGSGRRSLENFAALLAGAPRCAAGPTAAASGLTLEQVYFDARGGPLPMLPRSSPPDPLW